MLRFGVKINFGEKILTKNKYFSQNFCSHFVLIFRPCVRKWSFWGELIKGLSLKGISCSRGLEVSLGAKFFLTPYMVLNYFFPR